MNGSESRVCLSLLGVVFCAPISAQVTSRVSVSSAGNQADDSTTLPSISADGRFVAFRSDATNLVVGDTNGFSDAFVRDRASGTTERVSVDSAGAQGNSFSANAGLAISADGRFVAYTSFGTNLVAGDTNGSSDIFVRDRQLGTTERVSLDSSGAQVNGDSLYPSISADGRYVAFLSSATNLVAGDTNGFRDVFVRDRQLGTTERVSIDSAGAEGNNASGLNNVSISADGRFVAFPSSATNLVAGDTNSKSDIFVRDRQLGTTERVSVGFAGAQGDSDSDLYGLSTSADGRHVAFTSHATNLVAGDTNGVRDVFVRDRQSSTTERVSVSSAGAQGNAGSVTLALSISADGRYVAYVSGANNLVAGDTNAVADIFVRDRQLGTTERVSVNSAGVQGNQAFGFESASISADGRYVAYTSAATNLVAGDTNGTNDVFVRDRLGDSGAPMVQSCFPGSGGVIACPCGQPANPAGGCANFGPGSTTGADLNASGVASVSADTVLLTTSNHRSLPGGVLNVFFSYKPGASTPTTGVPSGAGVRCIGAGGALKRLYTVQCFGGTASKPGVGDLSVSARSATFAGHAIVPPETRFYFNVYRDGQAGGPCGNPLTSTNTTNLGMIVWAP